MEFTVRDWMITLLVYIDPEATVKEALSVMRRRYIHSLIVAKSENNPAYGILTSTDICDKIIGTHADANKVLVKDIMTAPLTSIQHSATIQECAILMNKLKIRHLPVANDHGELIGMISATDFLVVAEAMAS